MADENSLKRKEQEFLYHLKQKCDVFCFGEKERGIGVLLHKSLWEIDNQGNGKKYNKIARKLIERGYITLKNGSRNHVKYISLTKRGLRQIAYF